MHAISNTAWKRSLMAGGLIGAGFMAAIDEIIFHQLLAWHHFYDRATPLIGLMSDGFLHAAELIAFTAGFFLFYGLRQQRILIPKFAWAGFFLGMGIFQIFDGIVDHKILRLHQIRYGVENILIYDITWNAFGALLVIAGWALYRHARRSVTENA